jgi:hypothetical protein
VQRVPARNIRDNVPVEEPIRLVYPIGRLIPISFDLAPGGAKSPFKRIFSCEGRPATPDTVDLDFAFTQHQGTALDQFVVKNYPRVKLVARDRNMVRPMANGYEYFTAMFPMRMVVRRYLGKDVVVVSKHNHLNILGDYWRRNRILYHLTSAYRARHLAADYDGNPDTHVARVLPQLNNPNDFQANVVALECIDRISDAYVVAALTNGDDFVAIERNINPFEANIQTFGTKKSGQHVLIRGDDLVIRPECGGEYRRTIGWLWKKRSRAYRYTQELDGVVTHVAGRMSWELEYLNHEFVAFHFSIEPELIEDTRVRTSDKWTRYLVEKFGEENVIHVSERDGHTVRADDEVFFIASLVLSKASRVMVNHKIDMNVLAATTSSIATNALTSDIAKNHLHSLSLVVFHFSIEEHQEFRNVTSMARYKLDYGNYAIKHFENTGWWNWLLHSIQYHFGLTCSRKCILMFVLYLCLVIFVVLFNPFPKIGVFAEPVCGYTHGERDCIRFGCCYPRLANVPTSYNTCPINLTVYEEQSETELMEFLGVDHDLRYSDNEMSLRHHRRVIFDMMNHDPWYDFTCLPSDANTWIARFSGVCPLNRTLYENTPYVPIPLEPCNSTERFTYLEAFAPTVFPVRFDSGDMLLAILSSIFVAILLSWCYRPVETGWQDVRRRYIYSKQIVPYNGRCEPNWLPDMESDLDVTKYPPDPDGYLECDDPELRKVAKPAIRVVGVVFSAVFPSVFSTSTNNLIRGLKSRVLLDVPKANPGYWAENEKYCPKIPIAGGLTVHAIGMRVQEDEDIASWEDRTKSYHTTFAEWNARFPPGRSNANIRALKKLMTGYKRKSNNYSAFIKRELAPDVTQGDYIEARPRVIQACSHQMKVLGGPFLYSVGCAMKFSLWFGYHIYYASGRTAAELNHWFNFSVVQFKTPVFITTDFSKYDVTQGELAIEDEINWLTSLGGAAWMPNTTWWDDLMEAKRNTVGYSTAGGSSAKKPSIRYGIPYKRKSGENETSLGNTRCTARCIGSWYNRLGVKYRIAVLGDDNFSMCELEDLVRGLTREGSIPFKRVDISEEMVRAGARRSLMRHCSLLGFSIKVDVNIGEDDLIKGEFLSLRFYPTRFGYRVGKKPGRNLVKIGWMKDILGCDRTKYLSIWYATMNSMRPTSMHVPFLRVYITTVLDYCEKRGVKEGIPLKKYGSLEGREWEADALTFAAFEKAYGLTYSDEVRFARELSRHLEKFGLGSCMDLPVVRKLWKADLC